MIDKYKIFEEATSGIFDEKELDITGLSNGADEFAKKIAIAFAEWLKNSNYEKSAYNGLYYEKNQVIYTSIQYTLGQLYELYLKTQK